MEQATEAKNHSEAFGGNYENFFYCVLCVFCVTVSAAQAIAATTPPKGAVLTWHDDNFRTGWQQQETILTRRLLAVCDFRMGWCLQIKSTHSRSSYQASSMATTLFLWPTNRIGSSRSNSDTGAIIKRSILGVRSRGRLIAGIMGAMWELIPLQ